MRIINSFAFAATVAAILVPQVASSAERVCKEECSRGVCREQCITTEGRGDRRDERRDEERENRREDRRERGPGLELQLPVPNIRIEPRS